MECAFHPGEDTKARCNHCAKSLCGDCRIFVAGKVVCKACETLLNELSRRELENSKRSPLFLASVLGFMTALLGAVLWGKLALYTNHLHGFSDWVTGVSVGLAVVVGAHGRRGREFQLLAAGLGLLGIFLGEAFLVHSFLVKSTLYTETASFRDVATVFPDYLTNLSIAHWAFAIFGVYLAFRLPRLERAHESERVR